MGMDVNKVAGMSPPRRRDARNLSSPRLNLTTGHCTSGLMTPAERTFHAIDGLIARMENGKTR